MRALVIFERENSHWLAPLLNDGIRHVWCVILDRHGFWVSHNLNGNGLSVCVEAPGEVDLAEHYMARGLDVHALDVDPSQKHMWPVLVNSCVGYTKTLLGLRTMAFTPHQLRNHILRLTREGTTIGETTMRLNLTIPGFGSGKDDESDLSPAMKAIKDARAKGEMPPLWAIKDSSQDGTPLTPGAYDSLVEARKRLKAAYGDTLDPGR